MEEGVVKNEGAAGDESASLASTAEQQLFREPGEGLEADLPVRSVRQPPRILSVSGAKGGVGKSVLTSNLAVYLASIGRDVIIADADVQGANMHTLLGVRRSHVVPQVSGSVPESSLSTDEVLQTQTPGLRLWSMGMDEPRPGQMRRRRRAQLAEIFAGLDCDYVVVDLGSGVSSSLLDFHLGAELSVFVTLPEPTAIENTYRFVRHAFVRYLRRVITDRATRLEVMDKVRSMGGAPPPLDLWRSLEDEGDPLADSIRSWMESFRPSVVLNQTRLRADLELGEAIRTACRRRMGIGIDFLGHIDQDDSVWSCVRSHRPLLIESPGSKAARTIEKIARRILARERGKGRQRWERTVPPESYHDLLEVDRGATDEDIRRAFKRARDIYSPNALCGYGLFEPEELQAVRARLDEAFDVLLDPARRRPYELSVFPVQSDDETATPSQSADAKALPAPPPLTPDTEFSGDLIQAVRLSKGIELLRISKETKVGRAFLVAIEEEDFAALPAPVYVRGFVGEVAKILGLDPSQVSRTYVKRYKRFLGEKGRGF